MRNFKTLLVVLLCITAVVWADITIKGDARVRPRLDQKFSNGTKTSSDIYYMYWVRLWLDATLTDGWYFKTKLAADGPGDFGGRFGTSTYDGVGGWTNNVAAHSGDRAAVRFVEFQFGRNTDNWGFSTGYLPFNALANPEYDVHFYPTSSSDIPYVILNQNSAAGFRGYYKLGPGKLNASLTVDNNRSQYSLVNTPADTSINWIADGSGGKWDTTITAAVVDDEVESKDGYSLFLDYSLKLGDISIQPTAIITLGDENEASPMTFGANLGLPKLAGISTNIGGYFTTQSAEGTDAYSGPGIHVKVARRLGPGTFVAWGDYKAISNDNPEIGDINTTLLWVMYKYVVYSSDLGSFAIVPTYRRIMQEKVLDTGTTDFARNKIELTMHFTFK